MATHIVETNVSNLKINKLTQAQYTQAVQQGVIGDNELSIITDVVDGVVTVMPTPSAEYVDTIVQFAGTTDVNYTNGYFYKCVSDGATPPVYSWTRIDVQPQGDSLPSQTGNSGKFLTTDGTDASWSDILKAENDTLSMKTASGNSNLKFEVKDYWGGSFASAYLYNGNSNTGWGFQFSAAYNTFQLRGNNAWLQFGTNTNASTGIAGKKAFYPNYGTSYATDIMLGMPNHKWNTTYTTKINNGADITIPNTAGTMLVADNTGATAGQVLTLDSNGNAVWASATKNPQTMPVLVGGVGQNAWDNKTQTVTVQGVTTTNSVFVAPAPASAVDYATAGVLCTSQGTNSLTFTCTTVPSNDITVNVVIL